MIRALVAFALALGLAAPAAAQSITVPTAPASPVTCGSLSTVCLAVSPTWNNGATVYSGVIINATNTASAATSKLLDAQVGGVSQFSVDLTGVLAANVIQVPGSSTIRWFGRTAMTSPADGTWRIQESSGVNTGDIVLEADSIFAFRRTTNPYSFRLYNTWTNASNYERFAATWSSNVLFLRNQNAGTGSARLMVPVTGATTVGALPAAATAGAGARSAVTDAAACTFTAAPTGGGSTFCPVVSDGAAWIAG